MFWLFLPEEWCHVSYFSVCLFGESHVSVELNLKKFSFWFKHRTFPEACRCFNEISKSSIGLSFSIEGLHIFWITNFS